MIPEIVVAKQVLIKNTVEILVSSDISKNVSEKQLGLIQLLTTDVGKIITDKPYLAQHVAFLNVYFHSVKTKSRVSSFFMIWELFRVRTRSSYNREYLESYINSISNEYVSSIEADEKCIRRHFKNMPKLFDDLLEHMDDYIELEETSEIDYSIIEEIGYDSVWKYDNVFQLDDGLEICYPIHYKGVQYYITYTLIGIYYCNYKELLPKDKHIRASIAVIDPILTIFLAGDAALYNGYKNFLKIGYYYVSVSKKSPASADLADDGRIFKLQKLQKIEQPPMSLNQYVSPIITKMAFGIPLDKQTIVHKKPKVVRRKQIKHTCRSNIEYESDDVDVEITYYSVNIETMPIVKRPTITPVCRPEIINDIHIYNEVYIQASIRPLHIVFNKYSICEKDRITDLLNATYKTNSKFREFINKYDTIKVLKSLHYDTSRIDKSLHFNCVFINKSEESTVYHLYVFDEKIYSCTTIINIL
jgi:hypothetical protein